ncbi:Polygalacturonase [Acorus gramineus]|uniref:Polygalacturonase n=1 Tax=Acorus gramineus TaxID=55184 RepID=A0AAV9BS13_ACOGR|nr:Polygalacturonase [Acorus gramineus]
MHERMSTAHKHHKHENRTSPSTAPHNGSHEDGSRVFDVLSFGAKGDGMSDDSKAIISAWKAACKVGWATVEIPSEFKFLMKPLTLQGPCMPHLVLQNFTIQGSGTVDGHGSSWWKLSQTHHNQALRFYQSYNVTVRDITIIDSPQCHLKFDSSRVIKVQNITIVSPGDSPNTDGVHLQNTHDVEIWNSSIGCGDDCVSIQTGSSNVHVHHINCGPGHGISLGGLGKDHSLACVSNITVENIYVENALTGVRIKTWQGGTGSVRNITFSNVRVADVEIPIVIDQYYCGGRSCKNQTRAVEISSIQYRTITGTFSVQPVYLACSDSTPCTNISLVDIRLSPAPESQGTGGGVVCYNSYGESSGHLVPSNVNCLKRSSRLFRAFTGSHGYTC